MADLSNPHDLFFKDMVSRPEVAADFLATYLPPEVAALLDLDPGAVELADLSLRGPGEVHGEAALRLGLALLPLGMSAQAALASRPNGEGGDGGQAALARESAGADGDEGWGVRLPVLSCRCRSVNAPSFRREGVRGVGATLVHRRCAVITA